MARPALIAQVMREVPGPGEGVAVGPCWSIVLYVVFFLTFIGWFKVQAHYLSQSPSPHTPSSQTRCAAAGAAGAKACCSSGLRGGSPPQSRGSQDSHCSPQSPIVLKTIIKNRNKTNHGQLMYEYLPGWLVVSSQLLSTAPSAMNWIQCLTSVTRAYTPRLGHSSPKLTMPI